MTDKYFLLGNPVSHSLSPRIFTLFAEQTGADISYKTELTPVDEFSATVKELIEQGAKGANVTLPFKLDAISVADDTTPRAHAARAANTLVFGDNTILADNTDGAGLILDLARLELETAGLSIMIIGAGGACRGILQPLLDASVKNIYIVNRTVERVRQVLEDFSDDERLRLCTTETFSDCEFDAVINASSASVKGHLPDFLPQTAQQNIRWGYDLFYSQNPTVFIRWLREQQVTQAHDGIGMLVGQAAESFFLWRGSRPEMTPVISALKQSY